MPFIHDKRQYGTAHVLTETLKMFEAKITLTANKIHQRKLLPIPSQIGGNLNVIVPGTTQRRY